MLEYRLPNVMVLCSKTLDSFMADSAFILLMLMQLIPVIPDNV